jgi:hypothetical protein
MKLLISAYACAPNRGSDYAVGWNWATEAHRLGHEIWVLASPVHRADIVAACSLDPTLAGIHWIFPSVRSWRLEPGIEPEWERTYNIADIQYVVAMGGVPRCAALVPRGGVRRRTSCDLGRHTRNDISRIAAKTSFFRLCRQVGQIEWANFEVSWPYFRSVVAVFAGRMASSFAKNSMESAL